jgi:hypothetical protein
MPRPAAVCAALLCACSFPSTPTLLPPPFGPDVEHPEPARFFFPTGVVIDPSGSWVVVSNANADRLYDAGAMYSFRAADIKAMTGDPHVPLPFPSKPVMVGAVITGNFTGPMVLAGNPMTGSPPLTAYTASRDTNRLNSVVLDQFSGLLSCRRQDAASGPPDCRAGSIDLNNATALDGTVAEVEGPFGVAAGAVRLPGAPSDTEVVMVTSQVPRIEDIENGLPITSSHVVALDQADPTRVLFSATVTNRFTANNVAGGPMVFDDRSREAIVSGCFSRFASASAGGELSTLKCGTTTTQNLLRFVPMDAGSSAVSRLYDLGPQIHSTDTTGLALGSVDATTGLRRLYLVTRFPDTFARVSIPADPAFGPVLEQVTTISSLPSQIFLIQRPAGNTGPDLLAVTAVATFETSTSAGKLLLIDGFQATVVGQVDEIGDTPFFVAQFPPAAGDTNATLVVTQFGSCGLTLIDVPYDDPALAGVRAKIGSCPP